MDTRRFKRAFTLIELMVVVGIIAILTTIVLAAMSTAKENTREKKRVADLANIEFALKLYQEKERDYPSFDNGVVIGTGGTIDDSTKLFNGNIYTDPAYVSGEYEYWYDSNFTCTAPGQIVLFARTMEQSKNANFDEVCTHPDADRDVADSHTYIKILEQTSGGWDSDDDSDSSEYSQSSYIPNNISDVCPGPNNYSSPGFFCSASSCSGSVCYSMGCSGGLCTSCYQPTSGSRQCSPWP